MSSNIEALDALFQEFLGEDSRPLPAETTGEQSQAKVLQSVESASKFLAQTGDLALGLTFKLSA